MNELGTLHRSLARKKSTLVIWRKLQLFGHVCGSVNDDRKIKSSILLLWTGRRNKSKKKLRKTGQPHREWGDDVVVGIKLTYRS